MAIFSNAFLLNQLHLDLLKNKMPIQFEQQSEKEKNAKSGNTDHVEKSEHLYNMLHEYSIENDSI